MYFIELYKAATEQLGSDKALIRMTALYTLERLANDYPKYRQTVVNIICAYLRMPFAESPPPETVNAKELAMLPVIERAAVVVTVAEPAAVWQQERHVRLAAQRILHTHLRASASTHWTDLSLDLIGATLIDFTLAGCALATANFREAAFSGAADFREATFSGPIIFREATFAKSADFRRAAFSGAVDFRRAAFSGAVDFREAAFSGYAGFFEATFSASADFGKATFSRAVSFGKATFSGIADFRRTALSGTVSFGKATFSGTADFREATFSKVAQFTAASFEGGPEMAGATVTDASPDHHVLPRGWRIEPAEGRAGRIVAESGPEAPPGSVPNGA
ncbi:pentapeptide repeat-containing protein [Actinomadura sp. 6N118]|uniref:pentapeptide repeat-containing protein n=1 Tax=Actinomadura sp. 6N118 TaxID=3375151 RepID=UPI0037BD775C